MSDGILHDPRQQIVPGAEASDRQALQARAERRLRGTVPQQPMDGLGLWSSDHKQRDLPLTPAERRP